MMAGFDFERSDKNKDEWLTPPKMIRSLGDFDLDPCSPITRPWDTALAHYTVEDMGLLKEWNGRIWLNPPYGNQTKLWLEKLSLHGNGIALIFARTDTPYFHEYVFNRSSAVLFLKKRIRFYHVSGKIADQFSGSPSVLVAYGQNNSIALNNSNIEGKYIKL